MSPKPLVVAVPRSGFSLLIQVVQTLLQRANRIDATLPRQQALRMTVELAGAFFTERCRRACSAHVAPDDLIYNGEFHLLVGGPKWVDKSDPRQACFRKYFGLRGQGDFLLVTSHPAEVLDYYPVVHSHTSPPLWIHHPVYGDRLRLTSIRNPYGIINSACFSLNAMASEYVQRFMPRADEDFLRQRLALYKLTDLEFVRGLVKFLSGYLKEYLPVRNAYREVRWEDLIQSPGRTIRQVARWLELDVSDDEALAVWGPMDHVNTLEFHKHNFRRGKGIVGDWKNSLVNEHLEVFREFGLDKLSAELGYEPIQDLDPRGYSPFQTLIAQHLRRGEVFRSTGDPDLFGFAFNKSNIDASKFSFKSFAKRPWTHVERSSIADDAAVLAVSDAAESACEQINRTLREIVGEIGRSWNAARQAELQSKWAEFLAEIPDGPVRRRTVDCLNRAA